MRSLHVLLIIIVFWCCDKPRNENAILDVRAIVNKTPEETESLIGKPDSTYSIQIVGKSIYCQLYKKHGVEIQYPVGLATDIVVYGPHLLPFNQSALGAFNLDYNTHHPKEFRKDRLIRWFDVDEFATISFYNPAFDTLGNISNFDIYFKAKD